MKFENKTKLELCKIKNKTSQEALSELCGMILFSQKYSKNIILQSENREIVNRAQQIISKYFSVILEIIELKDKTREYFILKVPDTHEFSVFMKELNIGHLERSSGNQLIVKNRSAFLRGVFLSCGYLKNPNIENSLAFYLEKEEFVQFLSTFIESTKELGFILSESNRVNATVLYTKNSTNLIDFITFIGASRISLELLEIKAIKEMRNYINRKTNFETANLNKISMASAKQIKAIKILEKKLVLQNLHKDLIFLAKLRINNPHISLSELGKNFSPALSRSCINRKLNKLISLSEKYS